MFHIAAYSHQAICDCSIYDVTGLPRNYALIDDGAGTSLIQKPPRNVVPWKLSQEEMILHRQHGFEHFARLVGDKLSEVQSRLKSIIGPFAKGISTENMGDRAVNVFSALEGLLLKSRKDSLSVIPYRLAYITEDNPAKRKLLVKAIDRAYDYRSSVIHRRVGIDDEGALGTFFEHARLAITRIAVATDVVTTNDEMFDLIDLIQFGQAATFRDAALIMLQRRGPAPI
jgi:hypothetical protein